LKKPFQGGAMMNTRTSISIFILVLSSLLISSCATTSKSLLKSVKENEYGEVAKVLDKGADVNWQTKWGYTALMYASFSGNEDLVKLLIEEGADVNARTAKNVKKRFNMKSRIRQIKRHGIEKYSWYRGLTALMIASGEGYTEIASLLIESGADVNAHCYYGGDTALMVASRYGHQEIAKLLIEKGANVKARDYYGGDTALMVASRYGHQEVTELLIEEGADVNAQSEWNSTALMLASSYGHTEVTKLLLEAGADVNAQVNWYSKSYSYTPKFFGLSQIKGCTALMYASMEGHTEDVKLLIEAGADVNLQDKDGYTALMCASEIRYTESVGLLLEAGADVNVQDSSGYTALMVASEYGCIGVAKLLLEAGADVNVRDNYGYTALELAKRNGVWDIVKLLREAGAKE
jgi:ankyrin repeat protein